MTDTTSKAIDPMDPREAAARALALQRGCGSLAGGLCCDGPERAKDCDCWIEVQIVACAHNAALAANLPPEMVERACNAMRANWDNLHVEAQDAERSIASAALRAALSQKDGSDA